MDVVAQEMEKMKEIIVHMPNWLGDAVMALTDIISEPYPGYSVIPSRCRVTYDRRLLAGETLGYLRVRAVGVGRATLNIGGSATTMVSFIVEGPGHA